MQIQIKPNAFFIFDLDDTLYPEVDFVCSGFQHIADQLQQFIDYPLFPQMWNLFVQRANVFEFLVDTFKDIVPGISVAGLLQAYRHHIPTLTLPEGSRMLLQQLTCLKIPAGLITDGRSITQRNKIKALGLEHYFKDVIISEEFGSAKPAERNFRYFINQYPTSNFFFVGDNTSKDFQVPTRLGWFTICLKNDGRHIHPQNFSAMAQPSCIVESLGQLQLLQLQDCPGFP
ncbi:MAG TPA: HAD family hydrolase [Chitinophagaceae bacterium]|nr:HAD family hydrolase [Chitinophagaceae bacterium]